MSKFLFTRSSGTLTWSGGDGFQIDFDACNNVDSHSHGPWPPGTYPFAWYDKAAADGPDGAYGSYGVLIFSVPGRSGMGVHSGRYTVPDGLGRTGMAHATMGCIRTTDEAMAAIIGAYAGDPPTEITVE
jgi:hypothetical protein